jgi:hypothetical protein
MDIKNSGLHVNVVIALRLADHPILCLPFPFNRCQNVSAVETLLENLTARDATIVS